MSRDKEDLGIIEERGGSKPAVDDEFLQDFIVETCEHLEQIEADLLVLDTDPNNLENIHSLFRSFHTIKGLAGFVDQELIGQLAHQTESILDACRKGKALVNKTVIDHILGSADRIKQACQDIGLAETPQFVAMVEDHIRSLQTLGQDAGDSGLTQANLGEASRKELSAAPLAAAFNSDRDNDDGEDHGGKGTTVLDGAFMRIPTHKVDNLVDLLGELLIVQSLVEQEAAKRLAGNDGLTSNLLRMARITKEIQNLSMSLRMVSLKSTFQKIARVARDTADELAKDVIVSFNGEETEIDRSVADKLLDPLLHLVKNSLAHGIESPQERLARRKSSQGRVMVQAYSRRGSVYIEVTDDGAGIDTEKVRRKAVEKKLISPAKSYGEDELINCLFLPGFSTAETVDNISGRGVGLDVVKTEISKIGGKIEIASEPGQGCTFSLKIPINLAIINGTIIDMAGSRYVLPTLNMKRILRPEEGQWISVHGHVSAIRLRDDIIPLVPVGSVFGLDENLSAGLIIVVEMDQQLRALPIQSIVGKQEIVVKPLSDEFSGLDFVSGATILGDGRVALILDIESLFRKDGETRGVHRR